MITLEIPNRYLALSPILITSPTARCGTTFVQRLLSTSKNAFFYGEAVADQMRTLTTWLWGLMTDLETAHEKLDADYARAIGGDLSAWKPGLTPPTAVMLKAWVETYYQFPTVLTEHAASIGRPIWGAKAPAYPRDTLKAVLRLLPQAKIIYLFRHLDDVVRSSRARRFVTTDAEVAALCADWARNMSEVSQLAQDERVLFVKYEDMIAQRADYVRLLELFTGAEEIDPRVFDVKVNTFEGEEVHGHAKGQYIAPAPLTPTDREAIAEHAGPILERLYGA
jgi:hypothetical protein